MLSDQRPHQVTWARVIAFSAIDPMFITDHPPYLQCMSDEILFDAIRQIEDRSGAFLNVACERVDAPFVIERGSRTAVERAARRLGFAVAERDGFLVLQERAHMHRDLA